MNKLSRFWQRLSDGFALEELWQQLRHETTSSYRLYQHDAATSAGFRQAATPVRGATAAPAPRARNKARDFVWAILLKMSPARRVVLLAAIFLQFTHYRLLGLLLILGLLALEIADRVSLKRDLEIARDIQAWLLPQSPPVVPGAELAFINEPANTVSGDFYDAFWRGPGSLLLAVADVAGKGIPAALLTATFQASLHTLATEALSLHDLIIGLNRYACGHSAGGTRFTTAWVGEYHPASRRLHFINAGHNPPLLRRAAGGLEKLEQGGVPIGILSEAAYSVGAVELQPGDALVVFTDGVTETFNSADEEYGEVRLEALLQRLSVGLSAAAIQAAIAADCARFRANAARRDDLTCLVLTLAAPASGTGAV